MIQTADEFQENLRRDIARWEADIAKARPTYPELANAVQQWIDAGRKLLAELEAHHTSTV